MSVANARDRSSATLRPSNVRTAHGMLQDVVDRVFEGSISAVVQQLIETSDLNAEELKAIRLLVNRRTKESGT